MSSLIAQHTQRLASYKYADANDGQDKSYEQSMSDLAHVVLRDKAPALLDYEVGFQMIDRDEDNEKAIGVTVFKVGDNWLMAPMFFLHGQVKGSELLYMKKQDLFVPLQEEWVDDILNKQSPSLGKSTPRTQGNMGVSNPDLRSFNRPPNKWASVAMLPAREIKSAMADAKKIRPLANLVSLPAFLKKAGQPVALTLARWSTAWPKLAAHLVKFHGKGIVQTIKEAAELAPEHSRELPTKRAGFLPLDYDADHPLNTGSLQIFTTDRVIGKTDLLDDLTREELAEVRQGPLIKDDRTGDQVSIPFRTSVPRSMSNPHTTGLYDVLMRGLTYEKCAVLVNPRGADDRAQYCTVIRLSDKKFANVRKQSIWTGKQYSEKDWADWCESLPAADSLEIRRKAHEGPDSYGSDAGDESKTYDILVGPGGDALAPIYATYSLGEGDGGKAYNVKFDESISDCGTGFNSPDYAFSASGGPSVGGPRPVAAVNLGMSRGNKLWVANGNVYVPDNFRKLIAVGCGYGEQLIQLGTPADVTMGIESKSAPLEIKAGGLGYTLAGKELTPDNALIVLVAGWGLKEAAARELLREADSVRRNRDPVVRCRVKLADPYMTDSQPGAPSWQDPYMGMEQTLTGSVPSIPSQEQYQRVTDVQADPANFDRYDIRNAPDHTLQQYVQDAANSGRRELFDASAISSLLSTTQGDLQVDRYIGPLVSAVDALGRLLMNFYWHGTDFAERYGKDDLPALEDTLRNSFTNLGKTVINLKQKAVTDPLDASRDFDLDSLSEQT